MNVTWCDYLEIVSSAKLGHKKGIDWKKVTVVLGEKYKLGKDILEKEAPILRIKYDRYMKTKKYYKKECIAKDEVVLRCEELVNDESYAIIQGIEAAPVTDEPIEEQA